MIIKKIKLENYTVFEDQQIEFGPGINVIIGENGTGKTHILKVLYSACQSVDQKTSFAHKLVSTMLPDDYKISRLITRKQGNRSAVIRIVAGDPDVSQERILTASFHGNTKKWDADVTGESGWEESYAGLSSIFIPAKEILSHSYNLNAASEKNNVRFDDTYLDIINAAKIDISVVRNSASKDAMLKRIQEITHGKVQYDVKRDEFYLMNGSSKQEFRVQFRLRINFFDKNCINRRIVVDFDPLCKNRMLNVRIILVAENSVGNHQFHRLGVSL